MDRHDRLRAHLERATCAVCGDALAVGAIRILAERDDLAFVELPCPSCGAVTLGMVSLPDGSGSPAVGDAPDPATGVDRADAPPRPDAAPIRGDDVLDMHRFLAAWQGDLRGLVAEPGDGRMDPQRPGPGWADS